MKILSLAGVFLLSSSALALQIDYRASDAECTIPFRQDIDRMGFAPEDAMNNAQVVGSNLVDETLGSGIDFSRWSSAYLKRGDRLSIKDEYRGRYLVADLNTRDESGRRCRGVKQMLPREELIPELADKSGWRYQNYAQQVKRFVPRSSRFLTNVPGHVRYGRTTYCVGQYLTVCDLQKTSRPGVRVAKKIAQFITASNKYGGSYVEKYYTPRQFIAQRAWGRRSYTEGDYKRDIETGGSKGSRGTVFEGRILMPQFMWFRADPDLRLAEDPQANGIHETTAAVGQNLRYHMGMPISRGCIRLEEYAAIFVRWYIPRGARFFIHVDKDRYYKYPPR